MSIAETRGMIVRAIKQPLPWDVDAVLDEGAAAGANAVCIVSTHFVYLEPGTIYVAPPPEEWDEPKRIFTEMGQDPGHPWNDTTDVERLFMIGYKAQKRGMEVVYCPQIDSRFADWRGFMGVRPTYRERRAWASAYKNNLLGPLLPVVKELGAGLLVGKEMVQITKDLGAPFWEEVVRWVRYKGVRGWVSYGANWGWENDAEYNRLKHAGFYANADVDAVVVSGYWPMVHASYTEAEDGEITVDRLLSGEGNVGWWRRLGDEITGEPQLWCPTILDDLLDAHEDTGLPVEFGEIGYPNNIHAAHDPAGDIADNSPPRYDVSGACWGAFRLQTARVVSRYFTWDAGKGSVVAGRNNLIGTPLTRLVWGADPAGEIERLKALGVLE